MVVGRPSLVVGCWLLVDGYCLMRVRRSLLALGGCFVVRGWWLAVDVCVLTCVCCALFAVCSWLAVVR